MDSTDHDRKTPWWHFSKSGIEIVFLEKKICKEPGLQRKAAVSLISVETQELVTEPIITDLELSWSETPPSFYLRYTTIYQFTHISFCLYEKNAFSRKKNVNQPFLYVCWRWKNHWERRQYHPANRVFHSGKWNMLWYDVELNSFIKTNRSVKERRNVKNMESRKSKLARRTGAPPRMGLFGKNEYVH